MHEYAERNDYIKRCPKNCTKRHSWTKCCE